MNRGYTLAQFVKLHFAYIDTGAIGVVGPGPFMVYLALRRFERRGTHQDDRIHKLILRGYLVAIAHHGRVGKLLGISRHAVGRYLKLLTNLGWVRPVRLKDNYRAYIIGRRAKDPNTDKATSMYFSDNALLGAVQKLPKDARGWSYDAIVRRRSVVEERLRDRKALRRVIKRLKAKRMKAERDRRRVKRRIEVKKIRALAKQLRLKAKPARNKRIGAGAIST